MISGVDRNLLCCPDTNIRHTYIRTLIGECQQRKRTITPDIDQIIQAYHCEQNEEIKEALVLLIVQSEPCEAVCQFCTSERNHRSEKIRDSAVWFLTRYYPEKAPEIYKDQADDPNRFVRFWIAVSLMEYDKSAALDLMLSVWCDPKITTDWMEGIENDLSLYGDENTIPKLRNLAEKYKSKNLMNVIWRIERRLAVEYLDPPNVESNKYVLNSIKCAKCQRVLTVDSRYMNKRARCKECGYEFVVPKW